MKHLLKGTLILCLMFSLIPTTVFAETVECECGETHVETCANYSEIVDEQEDVVAVLNSCTDELPNAEVKSLKSMTLAAGDYLVYQSGSILNSTESSDLQVVMEFIAKDTKAEAEQNCYGQYTTDFFIKFDGLTGDSITADAGTYLAGNYGDFGWIKVDITGMTIEKGVIYPVISSVGFDFKYTDICESVKDFMCAMTLSDEILAANPNLKVTLSLGLSESKEAAINGNFTKVDEYVYDVHDFAGTVAMIGETSYKTLKEAFDNVESGQTIKLTADVSTTETYTIADGVTVTLDLNGKTIKATDTMASGNYELFYSYGQLTVKNGTIELTAQTDRSTNSSSSIFKNRGGLLTIESGTYKHLGGTYMAYIVDNFPNSFGDATTIINGGTLESSYIGIRNYLDKKGLNVSSSKPEQTGNGFGQVYINDGTVSGPRRAYWAQIASASAANNAEGNLTVTGGNIGLIDSGRSANATATVLVKGGTISKVVAETGELTVKAGTVGEAEIYSADGTKVNHIIDENGTYVMHEHTIDAVEKKDSTCTSTGLEAHYKCEPCGKLFSDELGTTEVTESSLVIEIKDHTYGSNHKCECGAVDPSYKPSTPAPEVKPVEPTPTATPTPVPTVKPTVVPTVEPTVEPTEEPAVENTVPEVADTTIVEEKATETVVEVVKENIKTTEGTAVVEKEALEAVVEATEEGASVILTLTETTEETVSAAEVSTEALASVAEAETDLVIELTDITVKLDAVALNAITEQADGEVIEIKAVKTETHALTEKQQDKLENHETAIVVTVQIFSDGEYIGDFNGGTATIKLPFEPEEGKAAEDYTVYYIDDNGELHEVAYEYVDGHMVFTTGHFSDYVIVYEGKAVIEEIEKAPEVQVEEPEEKGSMGWVVPGIGILVLILALILVLTKKKSS